MLASQHLPHFAVGCSEYPAFTDQHSSTVELISSEQGHLPWVGAFFTWVAVYNSVATSLTLVWTDTQTHMGVQHQRETDTQQAALRDDSIRLRSKDRRQDGGRSCQGGESGLGTDTGPLRKPPLPCHPQIASDCWSLQGPHGACLIETTEGLSDWVGPPVRGGAGEPSG